MTNITYTGPSYESNALVESFHSVPRFGHPDDVSSLLVDSVRNDYIQGLLFVPGLVFAFFLLWCFMVLLLKWIGKGKVGYLAGSGFKNPRSCWVKTIRALFLLCALLLTMSCTLFSIKGVSEVDNSLESIQDSSEEIGLFASQTYDLMQTLDEVGQTAIPIRDSAVKILNGDLCPAIPILDGLITDTNATDTIPGIATIHKFEDAASLTIQYLDMLNNFSDSLVSDFENAYDTFIDQKSEFDDILDTTEDNINWLAYSVIPVGVLAFLLALGTSLAWNDKSSVLLQRLQSWGVLPPFILMILVFMIGGLAIFPLGAINSDFCLGSGSQELSSPEGSILKILETQNIGMETRVGQIILYYAKGCQSDDPFEEIRSYDKNLTLAKEQVSNVTAILNNETDVLQLITLCDRNDYSDVISTLDNVTGVIDTLLETSDSALDLVKCEPVNKIYVSFVHDAICEKVPIGIMWMFSTFIILFMSGMVMVTLRSAWIDNESDMLQHKYLA